MSNQEEIDSKINAFFIEWKVVIVILIIATFLRVFIDSCLTYLYYKDRYFLAKSFMDNKVLICSVLDGNLTVHKKEYSNEKYRLIYLIESPKLKAYLVGRKSESFEMIEIGNCERKNI